jgi:hypothetical protein
MIEVVRKGLAQFYDPKLVDELLAAYIETKRNFYLGNLRPSEVEGGRFCEAAFRVLEQHAKGKYTQIGKQLNTEAIKATLENAVTEPDPTRFHIPRSLRVVYDIRNKRDAAHLGDGIDPNLQDSTLVVSTLDWVLAEFVRLRHGVSANEAQRIVESLVTRQAPVVQDFAGFLKVLNPKLSASDHMLVVLYPRGGEGATYNDLDKWARPPMKANLRRTLDQLTNERALLHFDGAKYYITGTGMQEVEKRKLYQMPK